MTSLVLERSHQQRPTAKSSHGPIASDAGPSPEVGSRLAGTVNGRSDWSGHFSVVEPDRIRMRSLSKLDGEVD
jgi:hypothetical protein